MVLTFVSKVRSLIGIIFLLISEAPVGEMCYVTTNTLLLSGRECLFMVGYKFVYVYCMFTCVCACVCVFKEIPHEALQRTRMHTL